MKKLSRGKIVPSLVRDVEQTATYPGYRYVYFKSFDELNCYFTATCGEDWLEQEWAKFWLRDHWRTVKQEQRDRMIRPEDSYKVTDRTDKTPRHLLRALARHYQKQGMSLRQIADELEKQDGIRMSHVMAGYLLKEEDVSAVEE